MHNPINRIAHTTAFVTPVVEHWLEREIAQWDGFKAARDGSLNQIWKQPTMKEYILITVIWRWTLGKGRKEMFYLTTHSTHFIYGYLASDIW